MAKTNDFTKMMQDMMASFPVDTGAMQEAFKTQAALAEKMSKVALEAAEKSTEITAKWTKDTLAKAGRWPPPADWLPKNERARSLILTGRPPPEKKRGQAGAR